MLSIARRLDRRPRRNCQSTLISLKLHTAHRPPVRPWGRYHRILNRGAHGPPATRKFAWRNLCRGLQTLVSNARANSARPDQPCAGRYRGDGRRRGPGSTRCFARRDRQRSRPTSRSVLPARCCTQHLFHDRISLRWRKQLRDAERPTSIVRFSFPRAYWRFSAGR